MMMVRLVSRDHHSTSAPISEGKKMIDPSWRKSMVGLKVDIEYSTDKSSCDRYLSSAGMVACFRVILPLASFHVFVIGGRRAFSMFMDKEFTTIRMLVCCVEALSNAHLCFVCTLGWFGANVAPFWASFYYWYYFKNVSIMVTFLVTLIAKEKNRVLIQNLPERALFETYFLSVLLTFVAVFGPSLIIRSLMHHDPYSFRQDQFAYSWTALMQIIISLGFASQAYALWEPLVIYMRSGVEMAPQTKEIISRLVLWLRLQCCFLGASALSLFLAIILRSFDLNWVYHLFFCFFTNILVSHAHIIITKPSAPSPFENCMKLCAPGCFELSLIRMACWACYVTCFISEPKVLPLDRDNDPFRNAVSSEQISDRQGSDGSSFNFSTITSREETSRRESGVQSDRQSEDTAVVRPLDIDEGSMKDCGLGQATPQRPRSEFGNDDLKRGAFLETL